MADRNCAQHLAHLALSSSTRLSGTGVRKREGVREFQAAAPLDDAGRLPGGMVAHVAKERQDKHLQAQRRGR